MAECLMVECYETKDMADVWQALNGTRTTSKFA